MGIGQAYVFVFSIYFLGINELRKSTVQNKQLIHPRRIGNILSQWDAGVERNASHRLDFVPNTLWAMIGQLVTHDAGQHVTTKMTGTWLMTIFLFYSYSMY